MTALKTQCAPRRVVPCLFELHHSQVYLARVAKDDAPLGFIEYDVNAHPPKVHTNYYSLSSHGFTKVLKQPNVEPSDCLKMETAEVISITGLRTKTKKPVVLFSVIRRADNPDAEKVLQNVNEVAS